MSALVRSCKVCDRDRNANPSPREPLSHLLADQPFALLYIDIISGQGSLSLGPSPKSIFNMINMLKGWAKSVTIVDKSTATVARAVSNDWFARYGVPVQLNSDRKTQFEAALFAELFSFFGTHKTQTTTYKPQTNRKCKRFNRTLVAMLRRAVQKKPFDWMPLLAPVLQ